MQASVKERFLIALAKFFGESPLRDKPLASLQLAGPELMDEISGSIVSEASGRVQISREKFNRLMINCGHRLATDHFFGYFFENTKTIEDFERAVDRYRIKAMWLFGNFRFAYRELATCDKETFQNRIARTESVSEEAFRQREPFLEIEQIPVENLHLLGYIAKGDLDDLELTYKLLQQLTSGGERDKVLDAMGTRRIQRALDVMRKHRIQPQNEDLSTLTPEQIRQLAGSVNQILEPLRQSRDRAVEIGEKNTERYLTLPHLDVYVATSMRDRSDFIAQHEFVKQVFTDPQVEPLRLRYFDPTLSYVESRITKGLIEMLMLRRAQVTLYVAGAADTLGKDSELAATLAQGKAVIVYVPEGEIALPCGVEGCQRKVSYDKRADTFREDHPLGLQIAVSTGVAHGIIVARSPEECAKMLRKVILRERAFTIEHEKGVFLLREKETKCVVRVVADDPLLTHAFWSYFNETTE